MTTRPELLVIEDDLGISTAIRDNCKLRGYRTRAAFDGKTGLQLLQERTPDLIVLDIMMPQLNGYQVCQRIRELEIETPILILSAKNKETDIVRGLEAGADDYLVKPFGIAEFFARVKAQLRRHSPAEKGIFQLPDCRFDPATHQIHHPAGVTTLTQKESGLLAYILTHPDQAIPRSKLLRHVWRDDPDLSERSVDRCVTTLRGKLSTAPTLRDRIKTLRGIGYTYTQS